MGFEGKIAIVTGGASGIGRQCCLTLARKGVTVVVADMNVEGAEKTSELIAKERGQAIVMSLNILDLENIKNLVNETVNKLGKVDIVINSAGICQEKGIEELTEKDWDLVMDVNLKGAFFISQAVLGNMKKNRYGKIVFLASLAGEVGGVSAGANYAASKAGIICLTKSLAKYAAPYNINVNSVSPGVIETAMTEEMRKDPNRSTDTIPLKRYGTTKDVADVISFLCSEEASYITGSNIDINGGTFMK
ncbi:SDR family NAD(P)-dependent oxidoreductase [Maledivibacter halophilus]|uniref:3-oxoacyl-[acyl-carrier protein] reductase n=1 Tax=Maledivibacter halophilus TaxID=36842 RepID=A0A1T5ME51_9FIRM|nr:SDR family NAD(P)-dependent oxidoreductase [Maledivibacter halophilus]SKC86516.1 3-oxoacyl-[acyl-carrier protein] reductase [Maledivibacter halophilus]